MYLVFGLLKVGAESRNCETWGACLAGVTSHRHAICLEFPALEDSVAFNIVWYFSIAWGVSYLSRLGLGSAGRRVLS
jgi:hypothetical protein